MVEEYKLKIPKPKDLPPSWFELVLRPERFQKHLETLQSNPYGSVKLLLCRTRGLCYQEHTFYNIVFFRLPPL